MKFDSNLAWQQASASISANRDVIFAIAGVFFLLPSLAFALLMPDPPASAGMSPDQAKRMMLDFYTQAMPWFIPVAVLQGIGSLALYALLTDRTRPTVAQAIRLGAAGFLPYIAAQLLIGLAIGLVLGLIAGLAVATGVAALLVIVLSLVFAAAVYVMIKTSLVAPVIMIEGLRNPVEAIRRSWLLTRGSSARLALFLLLVFIAFMMVTLIIGMVIGVIVSLVAGPEAVRTISAVVSSGIGAVMTVYFVAIFTAVHGQLAGGAAGALPATFE